MTRTGRGTWRHSTCFEGLRLCHSNLVFDQKLMVDDAVDAAPQSAMLSMHLVIVLLIGAPAWNVPT